MNVALQEPVDGVVTVGGGSIVQSAITVERVRVSRKPGDAFFTGTIKYDKALDLCMPRMHATKSEV